MRLTLAAILALLWAGPALAQAPSNVSVVTTCGTPNKTYVAGSVEPLTQNTSGLACGTGTSSVTGTVTTTPGARTLVTLAIKTVTTGGTAVTAIAAGARTAGGWIQNPPSATINLCINEIGVATGTTSSGDTTCIVPGQSYNVTPAAGAVSVISSDSTHPFSGFSFQ